MWISQVPSPVHPAQCVPCVAEFARWQGCFPSRVATMCREHYQDWQWETL